MTNRVSTRVREPVRPQIGVSAKAANTELDGLVGRTIEGFLFGVQPYDPLVLAGVALLLLAVAAIATLVPAWRASRIGPMVALRHEQKTRR